MKNSKLREFILNNKEWEKILLQKPYGLHIARKDGYIIFKYDMIDSDFSLPEVCEARGIIFRESDWKCVCHPFDKFFNAGEPNCYEINWNKCNVSQKIDGSLIKIWFDNKWHISTNGSIDAFSTNLESTIKFKTFGDLVLKAMGVDFEVFTNKMDKKHIYMFELVSPYNRIVIEYKEPKLYFLGERDMISDQEILPENSVWLKSINFKIDYPKRYNLNNLTEIKIAAGKLPWNDEGYVVVDDKFNRCKIKSPEYVKSHHLRNNGCITIERLMNIILTGEQDEFLTYCPDYKNELSIIENTYQNMINEIKKTIKDVKPEKYKDRKAYATIVMSKPQWIRSFLFNWNKIDEAIKKITAKKWIDLMESSNYLSNKEITNEKSR